MEYLHKELDAACPVTANLERTAPREIPDPGAGNPESAP
jgi:hypothetical protein